jgi:hypothetical protein
MKKKQVGFLLKLLVLGVLIGAEVYLGLFVLNETESKTLKGALSKEGSQYILRWVNDDKVVQLKNFKSPLLAMAFAQSELGLVPGENPSFIGGLEHVWLRKEMGKQVMLWKTTTMDQVHRLTFYNEQHARLFLSAFKQGAYSPSPLGHAIHLKPNAN